MSLLITRHGETDWNLQRKLQGKTDIKLNDRGKEQAKEIAKKLDGEQIDLIISSPLIRARQTAEIINERRNIPIIFSQSISERDFGDFEGKNYADFDFRGFWNYNLNNEEPSVENIRTFFRRVYKFLDKIKSENIDSNILLVAHAGISIPVYCYFNGIPENGDCFDLALHNSHYAKYEFERKNKKDR